MPQNPFIGVRSSQSPLIGRDKELQLFVDLLVQVGVDQGQILGVVALPGMGKSRIVTAYKELTLQAAVPLYVGTFTKAYQPYEAFRQVVSQITGSDATTLSRWDLTDHESDFLRLLLEPNAEIESLKTLSESDIRQGLFAAVKKLIFNAAKKPMVIILDDLHWAGEDSHAMLEYLIDDTEFTRLLLVIVFRPDIQLTWTRRLNYTTAKLANFDKLQIERFVRNLLDIDRIDYHVIDELLRVSHGNPLFLEEMLKHMLEKNEIEIRLEGPEQKSKCLWLRQNTTSMPSSIHTLIESRLELLPPKSFEAMKWASVFGSVSDTDELNALLQEKWGEDAKPHTQVLFKHGYLVERSVFPTRTYKFGHDLFFDTVLKSITPQDLPIYHKEIGDFLCRYHKDSAKYYAHRIAEHYVQSPDEQSALKHLHQAGINALKIYHYSEALYFFQKAYPLFKRNYVAELPEEKFYVPYIEVLLICGKLTEHQEAIARWGKNESNFTLEAKVQYLKLLVQVYDQTANYQKIIETTSMIKKEVSSRESYKKLFLETAHERINAFIFLGSLREAIHEGLSIIRMLEPGSHEQLRMRLWGRLAYPNKAKNKLNVAVDYLEKAENYFSESLPPYQQIELMSRFSNIYIDLNKPQETKKIMSQTIEMSKRHGLQKNLTNSLLSRGIYFFDTGDYLRSYADFIEALRVSTLIKDQDVGVEVKLNLVDLLLDLGAKDEAMSTWLTHGRAQSNLNMWQGAVERHIQSIFLQFKASFQEAAQLHRENAKDYKNLGSASRVAINIFRAIKIECEHQIKSIQELQNEFKSICDRLESSDLVFYNKNITAYILCAHGADVENYIDFDLDFTKCMHLDLRQLLYIAKIKWLDAKKKRQEAFELREVYRQERERICKLVPEKFRADFMVHPLYRVP